MAQIEVLDLFKENPDTWYCVRDLVSLLNLTRNCVSRNLRALRKFDCVSFEYRIHKITNKEVYWYRYKK